MGRIRCPPSDGSSRSSISRPRAASTGLPAIILANAGLDSPSVGSARATRWARFRRLEMLFSAIWGLLLLAECAARLIGACTLPVTTMVWLSTVLTLGAIGLGVMIGGAAARPIEKMAEAAAAARPARPGRRSVASAGR